MRLLEYLAARAAPVLAVGVFAGLVVPELARVLRPALVPAVFLIAALAFLRLEPRAVAVHARRPLLALLALLWLVAAAPALAWAAVGLASPPRALGAAILLHSMAPPVFAGVAIAVLMGLDAPLAALVTVAATFLAPLTLPPSALVVLGLELELGLGQLTLRLALFVAGAALLAAIARGLAGSERIARWSNRIDGVSVVLFLVFAVAIMDGVSDLVWTRPGIVLAWTGAAFATNLGLQAAGALSFLRAGPRPAATVAFMSGNRNLALVLAVLEGEAEPDLLVYFALGQIPIFALPLLLAPLYRRALRRDGAP